MDKRDFLTSIDGKTFVRFARRYEPGWIMGYVLDVGPEFFLLALVSDLIRFDGFTCTRIKDVRKLQVRTDGPRFPEKALKKRGLRIPKRPKVDLSNIKTLVETAGQAFPVVTIHRERVNSEICHIGNVVAVGKRRVSLVEIDPDAVWEDQPTEYKLSEITQVEFGGDYEDALLLVGGAPTRSRRCSTNR
jgi:hypothetical protein